MGSPTWADDPALGTAPGRVASKTLESRVAEWTRGQDVVDLMSNCQAAGVPAGVVQDSIDMVERDPQFAHDGFLKTLAPADEFQGETYYDRLAIRFAKTPCDDYRPVSPLGSDNTRVLTEWIGLTEEEIADADAAGDEGEVAGGLLPLGGIFLPVTASDFVLELGVPLDTEQEELRAQNVL